MRSQCQCQAKGLGLKPGLSREALKKGLDQGSDTTRSKQVIVDNFMKYFAAVFPH